MWLHLKRLGLRTFWFAWQDNGVWVWVPNWVIPLHMGDGCFLEVQIVMVCCCKKKLIQGLMPSGNTWKHSDAVWVIPCMSHLKEHAWPNAWPNGHACVWTNGPMQQQLAVRVDGQNDKSAQSRGTGSLSKFYISGCKIGEDVPVQRSDQI